MGTPASTITPPVAAVAKVPKAEPTGPKDIRDQRWLDVEILNIKDGIEAVVEIAKNWTEGRNLSRLHPAVSAQDYMIGAVGHALGRGVIIPLLEGSNFSHRQIAAIAGVTPPVVDRKAKQLPRSVAVDAPRTTLVFRDGLTEAEYVARRDAKKTLGKDGKLRSAPTPKAPTPKPIHKMAQRVLYHIASVRKWTNDGQSLDDVIAAIGASGPNLLQPDGPNGPHLEVEIAKALRELATWANTWADLIDDEAHAASPERIGDAVELKN